MNEMCFEPLWHYQHEYCCFLLFLVVIILFCLWLSNLVSSRLLCFNTIIYMMLVLAWIFYHSWWRMFYVLLYLFFFFHPRNWLFHSLYFLKRQNFITIMGKINYINVESLLPIWAPKNGNNTCSNRARNQEKACMEEASGRIRASILGHDMEGDH